nr:immunoglobulin light chain junction region [Macaca mulatta]MOX42212.1 immunoglobulin light chain junction region [Macaca mulatta]MOX69095.1 immunoglobulin light chain junction region [Macaca mulatta]MOX69525.1 immunoglobulin light chain junction region [Macaca mulatta]MOX69650.1 immunoglobulin light chain junction region [Macaca mulatta]
DYYCLIWHNNGWVF